MYLLMKDGSDSVIELGAAERLYWTFGRHRACEFVLDDPGISRFHATIFYAGDQLFLVDHSVNGTHVPHTQAELDAVMDRSLPLGTPPPPAGDDTQVIEPFEAVDLPDVEPEDLHKSLTELRITQSLTRVPRMPGYEARRPTDPETAAPILEMIHSSTECHNLAATGRRLHGGASIVLVGRERHLYSLHGADGE